MPSKSYDQLGPETQQAIDSAIFVTEADRIINRLHCNDGRDCFVSDTPALVNYLRGLYALDCQTRPARYFDWGDDSAGLVQAALEVQRTIIAATDGVSHLDDLKEHLTNLPYPQLGVTQGRGRTH